MDEAHIAAAELELMTKARNDVNVQNSVLMNRYTIMKEDNALLGIELVKSRQQVELLLKKINMVSNELLNQHAEHKAHMAAFVSRFAADKTDTIFNNVA